jgi:hypothetical protein
MQLPIEFNSSTTCYIPLLELSLDYTSCPDEYTSATSSLVRICCIKIITNIDDLRRLKEIQNFLTYYGCSLLLAPAVFFNLLALLVLRRFNISTGGGRTSTSLYMMVLCVLDTLAIVAKFIYEVVIIQNQRRASPIAISSLFCKLIHFGETLFSVSAIYLLIAMAIDKLICVVYPLWVFSVLTRKTARNVCIVISVIAAINASFHLFNQRVQVLDYSDNESVDESSSPADADAATKYVYDCDSKWPDLANKMRLVDNFVRVFIPIVVLFICNSFIAITLIKNRKVNEQLFSHSDSLRNTTIRGSSGANGLIVLLGRNSRTSDTSVSNDNCATLERRRTTVKRSLKPDAGELSKARYQRNSYYALVMLFSVTLGFVMLNLPFAVKTLLQALLSDKFIILDYVYHGNHVYERLTKVDIINAVKYDFFANFTHFLIDLSYVVNFFLYFFAGSKFRSQLFSMFKKQKPKRMQRRSTQIVLGNNGDQYKMEQIPEND